MRSEYQKYLPFGEQQKTKPIANQHEMSFKQSYKSSPVPYIVYILNTRSAH